MGVACRDCADGVYHDFEHGVRGYNRHKCRCDICKPAKAEEMLQYRLKHAEKLKEARRQDYQQNKEKIKETNRRYRADNPEMVKESKRKSYERNKEKIKEHNKRTQKHRSEVHRKWVERNPERTKVINQRYQERNADRIRERERNRQRDPEKRKEYNDEYQEQNRDRIAEQQQRYQEENRERIAEQQRQYYEETKHYHREQMAKYREKLRAIPGPRNGERWTPGEDAIILREDISLIEMCYMTDRGYGAVKYRREYLQKNESPAEPDADVA